jgi:hypothetical protein
MLPSSMLKSKSSGRAKENFVTLKNGRNVDQSKSKI